VKRKLIHVQQNSFFGEPRLKVVKLSNSYDKHVRKLKTGNICVIATCCFISK
jgi:hypothetical protein